MFAFFLCLTLILVFCPMQIYLRFLDYEMANSNECKRNFVAVYDGGRWFRRFSLNLFPHSVQFQRCPQWVLPFLCWTRYGKKQENMITFKIAGIFCQILTKQIVLMVVFFCVCLISVRWRTWRASSAPRWPTTSCWSPRWASSECGRTRRAARVASASFSRPTKSVRPDHSHSCCLSLWRTMAAKWHSFQVGD